MIRRVGWIPLICGLAVGPSAAVADQFEQLDGPVLLRALKGGEATTRASLTVVDLGSMPPLLKDTRSALVLARTDRGNPARLLIVPELRKPSAGRGEPIPVVVLERLDTFDAAEPATRLATRRDLVVFDGFRVDLDSGQVVPEGQGGDVIFRAGGEGGPRLESVGEARIFTLDRAPAPDGSKPPQPTPGKAVVAGDFAGRYRLFADGQWSGTLDLKVQGRGAIVGLFRSDLRGTTYDVTGQVAADSAKKVAFAIQYPRARQEFEGFLWAEGKGAIAGSANLNGRPAGFFAIREGGRYAPEGLDLGPITPADLDRPGRHVVEVVGAGSKLDGRDVNPDGLAAGLRMLVDAEDGPRPWVLIRVEGGRPIAEVLRVAATIREAGVGTIRLEAVE